MCAEDEAREQRGGLLGEEEEEEEVVLTGGYGCGPSESSEERG